MIDKNFERIHVAFKGPNNTLKRVEWVRTTLYRSERLPFGAYHIHNIDGSVCFTIIPNKLFSLDFDNESLITMKIPGFHCYAHGEDKLAYYMGTIFDRPLTFDDLVEGIERLKKDFTMKTMRNRIKQRETSGDVHLIVSNKEFFKILKSLNTATESKTMARPKKNQELPFDADDKKPEIGPGTGNTNAAEDLIASIQAAAKELGPMIKALVKDASKVDAPTGIDPKEHAKLQKDLDKVTSAHAKSVAGAEEDKAKAVEKAAKARDKAVMATVKTFMAEVRSDKGAPKECVQYALGELKTLQARLEEI